MKQFVLMSKKTGDLLIGYRMVFMDAPGILAEEVNECYTIMLGTQQQHGWIIEHPLSSIMWYHSMEAMYLLEVLSEL